MTNTQKRALTLTSIGLALVLGIVVIDSQAHQPPPVQQEKCIDDPACVEWAMSLDD